LALFGSGDWYQANTVNTNGTMRCSDEVKKEYRYFAPPASSYDETTEGVDIFVQVSCLTKHPLAAVDQDPIYSHENVHLDPNEIAHLINDEWSQSTCDDSYRFLFDKIEIRGKNWASHNLGRSGENISKKLDHCIWLSYFTFEWTPNDVKYEWYVYAQLAPFQERCAGKAVLKAGGRSRGHCDG
jgi:hypothetical protein